MAGGVGVSRVILINILIYLLIILSLSPFIPHFYPPPLHPKTTPAPFRRPGRCNAQGGRPLRPLRQVRGRRGILEGGRERRLRLREVGRREVGALWGDREGGECALKDVIWFVLPIHYYLFLLHPPMVLFPGLGPPEAVRMPPAPQPGEDGKRRGLPSTQATGEALWRKYPLILLTHKASLTST